MRRDAFERVKRAETVAQVLELGQGGRHRERWSIPRLTHQQIRETLSFGLRNGLLSYVNKDGAYKTTPKGADFLRSYLAMRDMFDVG